KMHLYNLTLQKPTGIACAITGTFSSSGSQELVVARGKLLELLRLDKHGSMQTILTVDVFCAIRSLANLTSQRQKDYIVVGSDSGLISILAYNEHDNVFEHIHKETVGKSGCRRIVPGQYLALDPKGRALMIVACEKQKLVYVLNQDSAANLTISSPLEAHKSCTITYSIVGVDCGWDNPVFAALELDYFEPDLGKHLTFYELDLGLNHVYRKLSQRVGDGANMLVAVPGGGDGPSSVLVCAENFVIYKNQDPGHPDVCAVIPRRALPAERRVLIVSATMHIHKSMFFFLLQTEYGDVFKVTLHHDNGFLFAASEFGNHALYQFQAIGTNPDVESSSSTSMKTDEGFQPVLFKPRGLKNLVRIDQMESLMPIMGMKVEFTEFSTLECSLWTVKKNINNEFDAYIVVSFANATLVLSIGGETIEEVSDSGLFLGTTPSLKVSMIGDDSLMVLKKLIACDKSLHVNITKSHATLVPVAMDNILTRITFSIENGFIFVSSVPAGTANAADTSLIIDLFRLELEQSSIVVLISGDTDYCEEDTGDMHQGVMGRIAELVWKASTHREIFIVHAFGKKTTVPTQQEDPYMTGITYFFTSNSPKMNPFSIENVMLVNMLSMATGTRVACDFVILTRKDLSQAIHFLRSLGHSVTTAMASCFDQSLHLM
ncbi:spliceosome-associated protein 130 A, partial [Tanacetum coccineum]